MKKNFFMIIPVIIFLIIIILLFKYNIFFFKTGTIDGLNYSTIDVDFDLTSKIVNHTPNDTLDIYEKYHEIIFNNIIYKSINSTLKNTELIENYIDEIIVNTIDENINCTISQKISLYKIKLLSQDTVIAIKFQNTDNYYIYFNSYCKPNTLNDLLEMYKLDEYVQFSNINYIKNIPIKNCGKQNIKLEFSNITSSSLKTLLNKNSNNKLEYCNQKNLNQYFILTTTSPLYDSKFQFYLTKEMNLIIPIPGVGNYFICSIENKDYNNFITSVKNTYAKATVKYILYN